VINGFVKIIKSAPGKDFHVIHAAANKKQAAFGIFPTPDTRR